MKSIKNSSKTTIALFVVALALLLVSTIGGTRAALTYFSDDYRAEIQTANIGVTLLENGKAVAHRNYNNGSWDEKSGTLLSGIGEDIVYGMPYDEELKVQNTGSIPTKVRATVYTYWLDANGEKDPSVNPELIDLNLVTGNGWTIADQTAERTVLNYGGLLGVGESTTAFADKLTVYVDKDMVNTVTQKTADGSKIITTYDYNGYQFVVEVTVDSVQDHHAEDAAESAWGIK